MKKIFTIILGLLPLFVFAQTSENEPNNAFSSANSFLKDSIKTGTVNNTTDVYDYFTTTLPYNGTVIFSITATNNGGASGFMFLNFYDARQGSGNLLGRYAGNTSNVGAGKSVVDTIRFYGRSAEAMYLRIESSTNFSYTIKYTVVDSSTNDLEPNDSYAQSLFIAKDEIKKGQTRYTKSGNIDNYDYYKTVLPYDGTLKIMVKGKNTSGTSNYLYLSGYDGRAALGQNLNKYISNKTNVLAGETIYDTIYMYGRGVDTVYFRLESSGAFTYQLQYSLIDSSRNDAEPNSSISQALPIKHLEQKFGHINYMTKGVPDNYDYYKTVFPKDGTLKIYLKGTNLSGSAGYLFLYGFDGRGLTGQVLGKYISNSSNIPSYQSIVDTIFMFGRATDTFYFRVESAGAFKYSISYEIIDTSANDTEPNTSISQALQINENEVKVGHINYIAKGVNDNYDYYKTTFQKDGTLKIYVSGTNLSGSNGFLFMYGFDGRRLSGQVLGKYISGNSNIPAYQSIIDTIYMYGRAKDTFYFRIESAGAFKYSLRYQMVDTSLNDAEPNNSIAESLPLNPQEIKFGHINYIQKGITDGYDYYRATPSEDGTIKIYINGKNLSGSNGYLFTYVFDSRKLSGQIHGQYMAGSNTIPNRVISDSITLYCRAKDTLYFRVESAGAFSYSIRYKVENTSPIDVEKNNNYASAILAPLGSKFSGHVGYTTAATTDNEDYYLTTINQKGSLIIYFEGTNTGGSNASLLIYGHDKRKQSGQILARYLKNNSNIASGQTLRDTIAVNCNTSDSFYMRVTSSSCFKYNFSMKFIDRQPNANTKNERVGNIIGFRPQFSNADKFIWDFGDGTTSTLMYPMKTFKIGFYPTKLIVTNSVCNYRDTATENIEVKGIEYYTPDSAGTGGDAMVKIFGAGLDTATKVTLKKGSIEIKPIRKFTTKNNVMLNAVFDLHLVNEGVYDMIIEIPGQAPVTYTNGFKVNKFRYPYTWSEVVAPWRWRTNTDQKVKLVVGNKGNVNASGVLVALIWPKTVNLKFDTKWFKPPASGNYTIAVPGKTFNFKWEDVQHYYSDSFRTISPIDSFNGQPYDGYMRLILIPKIAGGSTYEMPLIARSAVSGAQNFITYTFKPNIFGSCPDGSWMDMSENLAVGAADFLDFAVSQSPVLSKSPVGWLTKATKGTTTHMANLGQAMGAFYNYATGVTNSIDESLPADYMQNVDAGNMQVGTALAEIALDKAVQKGSDKFMSGQTDALNKYIANNPNASKGSFEFAINNLNDINDIRNLIKDTYKTTKDLKTLNDKLARLNELVKDCPELQKQLDDLKKELDKDMNLRDPKETKTNTATSWDPNAIYGPVGQALNQYINNSDRQQFTITFENVDTAKASAQIVTIRDTLDKKRFDLKSFEFNDVTVGSRTFIVPKGRKQFVLEDSVRPDMRVRINAELDTAKGIVTWQFTSIDKFTRDLPVFEGFLPPNVNKPEGEGSGSFSILPKLPLSDGAVFNNRASIVFDDNPAIATNTWQNIVDILPPSSTVSATLDRSTSTVNLIFSGNDATSGVGYYNLYFKENSGPWQAFGGSSTNKLTIVVEPKKTYSFYALANDKVGNLEVKNPVAEATVGVKSLIPDEYVARIYPNPVETTVQIENYTLFADYCVTDVVGKRVQNGKILTGQIDLSKLETGVYFITLNGKYTQTVKLLKK